MDFVSTILGPHLRAAETRCGLAPGSLGATGGPSSDGGGPEYENVSIQFLTLDGQPVDEALAPTLRAAADAAEPAVLRWGHGMRGAFAADAFHASFHDLRPGHTDGAQVARPDPSVLDLRSSLSRFLWARPQAWGEHRGMSVILRPGLRNISSRLLIHPVARYRSERPALALSEAATHALGPDLLRLQTAIRDILDELLLVEITWEIEPPTAHQRMSAARSVTGRND